MSLTNAENFQIVALKKPNYIVIFSSVIKERDHNIIWFVLHVPHNDKSIFFC